MKKKLFMLVALSCLLLPFNTNALTGTISLNCTKTTLQPGEETKCTIKGNTTDEVSAVSMKLAVGSNLTLTNITTDTIWQGDGNGGSIELYTDSNKSGNFNVATFTIKAGAVSSDVTTNVSLSSINLSDKNFIETSIKINSLSISISKTEASTDLQKTDSENVEANKPNDGDLELINPEDNNNKGDSIENSDDLNDDNIEENGNISESITTKEEGTDKHNTGIVTCLCILGIGLVGIVVFIVVKKKNIFANNK